jgi:hypothetical protein
MKQTWCIGIAFVVLAGLASCSTEPRQVTMHEPGVYKGDKDESLAKSQGQQQGLIDRLKLVQTDR